MFVGRTIGSGPLWLMYEGRVANLLAWVAISGLALRLSPACGRPFLLLLMMPMTLFQAASLSADPTTNGAAMLLAALSLRHIVAAGGPAGVAARISTAEYWGLLAIAATLGMAKFAYLPLLALLLLIPATCFGGQVRRWLALGLLGLVGLLALALWTAQTDGLGTVVKERPGVSPAGQARFLREHPSALLRITWATVRKNGSVIAKSFVGRLGWLDTPMPRLFTDAYWVVLAAACWLEERRPAPSGVRIALTLAPAIAASVFVIALLNYLYTMPVGWGVFDGFQGRYLIPLAPAAAVVLWGVTRRIPIPRRLANVGGIDVAITLFCCLSGAMTLLVVYRRYYQGGAVG